MALTLVVRSAAGASAKTPDWAPSSETGSASRLSITFDSPRLVLGRGEGADLRLPDPSVSARHASIRARGSEYVVVDEGSTNGTFLGRVMLAPQSPRVVRSGELVRVGRVWLELRLEAAAPTPSPAVAAKELALELVAQGLEAQGEVARPKATVVAGPDAGAELLLAEPRRVYVVGRAKECDLALSDADASRRHVELAVKGDGVLVKDLGSKSGVLLDGAPVEPAGALWRPGKVLLVGSSELALAYPAVDILDELERSPDEKIPATESFPPPRDEAQVEPPVASDGQGAAAPSAPSARAPSSRPPAPPPSREGWGLTDAAVLVLALGVLALGATGLWWLLGH